nr:DUF21 domain-containing protein [Mycoplasmopsis bovis]
MVQFFSASETAYTSLSPGRIETMVNNKEFGAKLIKKQHKFFNQLLSTILICNNIVNIALSAITSYLLSVWWLSKLAMKLINIMSLSQQSF